MMKDKRIDHLKRALKIREYILIRGHHPLKPHNRKNPSGLPYGVFLQPRNRNRRYAARLTVAGKTIFLGSFSTPEEAGKKVKATIENWTLAL